MKRKLRTVEETAEYLKVSQRTVRRYISSGLLTATRVGPRLIRIDEESIDALANKWKVGIH